MLLYFDFSRNAREKGLVKHQPINHQLRTWRRERLTRNHWKQILPNDRKSTGQLTWKLRKDCVSSRATLTKKTKFSQIGLFPAFRSSDTRKKLKAAETSATKRILQLGFWVNSSVDLLAKFGTANTERINSQHVHWNGIHIEPDCISLVRVTEHALLSIFFLILYRILWSLSVSFFS